MRRSSRRGHASVLLGSLVQEHERAAGAWHAEWEALSGVLAFSGGAADAIADALEGLEVDAERMRRTSSDGGLVLAERVAFALAELLGRAGRTRSSGRRRSAPRIRAAFDEELGG